MIVSMVEPLRVEVRLRNNRLIRLREDLGYTSAKKFADWAKLSYGKYVQLENMRTSPLGKNGDWRDTARQIAEFHGVSCDYIWPEFLLGIKKAFAVREVSEPEVVAPPSVEPAELGGVVRKALAQLTRREEIVLRMRHGFGSGGSSTLGEIADEFGVGRERVRQIERKALRRLRHPSIGKELKAMMPENALSDCALCEKATVEKSGVCRRHEQPPPGYRVWRDGTWNDMWIRGSTTGAHCSENYQELLDWARRENEVIAKSGSAGVPHDEMIDHILTLFRPTRDGIEKVCSIDDLAEYLYSMAFKVSRRHVQETLLDLVRTGVLVEMYPGVFGRVGTYITQEDP